MERVESAEGEEVSGLPWIKLYGNVLEHPKSDMLEAELGVERAWTHVVELWLWASKVRPDGVLGGMSDAVIAKRSGWSGDAEAFVAALMATGWLTEERVLVGWDEHQGAHKRKVERDRERRKPKPDASPSGTSAKPARVPSGTSAKPEGESEMEIEKEIPPTGGVGGEPSAPAPKPPKQRGPTWDELMAQDHEGRPFIEFARAEFPALDGLNGRPSLDEVLANAREWWRLQRGRRRWQTYRGALAWLRRDYPRHRGSWERDRANDGGGRVRSGPPRHDLHGNPIVLPPDYVWDEHDARFLAEGRAWLGPHVRPHWSEPREIRA